VRPQIHTKRAPATLSTDDADAAMRAQSQQLAGPPAACRHVAATPDVHLGLGATVGSVIPTLDAVIPAAVGVDIGCGMIAQRLSLEAAELPDSLHGARQAIEGVVPVGFDSHPASEAPVREAQPLATGIEKLVERYPDLGRRVRDWRSKWRCQLGTLGGGNHFIELCLDESNHVWVMLHSGSRGIGNAIGQHFIALAKRDMEGHLQRLPDANLAYFEEGNPHFHDYMEAVGWAQEYARVNRRVMMQRILAALSAELPPFRVTRKAINCHHNYVATEQHYGREVLVTRKGAIRAGEGELGIIPGSMGARSYIVRGRGGPDSFDSCAHGAGRRMSRRQAKKQFSLSDLNKQTTGVECRKDKGVLDEIPGAYKDIDQVMAHQSDLVEVLHTLKQVVCVKG
jgi:tRNA-splicing ligase RtcB